MSNTELLLNKKEKIIFLKQKIKNVEDEKEQLNLKLNNQLEIYQKNLENEKKSSKFKIEKLKKNFKEIKVSRDSYKREIDHLKSTNEILIEKVKQNSFDQEYSEVLFFFVF